MTTIVLADLAAVLGGQAYARPVRPVTVPKNTAGWIIAHTPGSEGGRLPSTKVPENTAGWIIQHTPVPPGFHIE